jgi:hypothetical protein
LKDLIGDLMMIFFNQLMLMETPGTLIELSGRFLLLSSIVVVSDSRKQEDRE